MSIGHLDMSTRPMDEWTYRNVHWTFECPIVQWTDGHV